MRTYVGSVEAIFRIGTIRFVVATISQAGGIEIKQVEGKVLGLAIVVSNGLSLHVPAPYPCARLITSLSRLDP